MSPKRAFVKINVFSSIVPTKPCVLLGNRADSATLDRSELSTYEKRHYYIFMQWIFSTSETVVRWNRNISAAVTEMNILHPLEFITNVPFLKA